MVEKQPITAGKVAYSTSVVLLLGAVISSPIWATYLSN